MIYVLIGLFCIPVLAFLIIFPLAIYFNVKLFRKAIKIVDKLDKDL